MSQDTSIEDRQLEASRRLAEVFDPCTIDALLADAKITGTPLDGVDGLLNQMTKAVIERALQTEMTQELGYERGNPAGVGSGNSRNGISTKTIPPRMVRSPLRYRETAMARLSRRSCRNGRGGWGRLTR